MTHTSSLMSPAFALLRIFTRSSPEVLRPRSHPATVHLKTRGIAQSRSPTSSRSRIEVGNNGTKAAVDPFPDVVRDEAILAKSVRITKPDGGVTPAEPLDLALSRIKPGVEHLVQISKPDDSGMVVCRIMTLLELRKQRNDKLQLEKEQKKSKKQSIPKQIELTWAIAPNDLEHKLTQLKAFLEDGKKVEVVIANKKRQRQATVEEGGEVLRKIRDRIAELDGKEVKPIQGGNVGQRSILTVSK